MQPAAPSVVARLPLKLLKDKNIYCVKSGCYDFNVMSFVSSVVELGTKFVSDLDPIPEGAEINPIVFQD